MPIPPPGADPGSSPRAGLVLVGVGPGDPDLLTVAAVRALQHASVIAYPVAQAGAEGMAAAIAAPWLRPEQRRLPLVFPMVSEAEPRQQAWHQAADQISALVARGERVVLLCEGDSSLFASGSYVLLALAERSAETPVSVIPGITAVSAAAAAASAAVRPWPLALQQDALLVRPTPDTPQALEELLDAAATTGTVLALLKLGRRWRWVQPLLQRRGLLDQALLAQRVGWPDQLLAPAADVAAAESPYFSLLLIRQRWPEVLP